MTNQSLISGPCLPHCYTKNALLIFIIIFISIIIGLLIGINLGILIKTKDDEA